MTKARHELTPRPILKWAGGKRQLLGELLACVSAANPYGRYHEPFLGGGALFFELARTGKLSQPAALSDVNQNLVEVYQAVRDQTDAVIALLQQHTQAHEKDHYYAVRADVPNELAARAARFIYLNKTCFNGLYRENQKGQFNVPMGRYKNPRICDADNLQAAAKALAQCDLQCAPFTAVENQAQPGDLIYFDPPYVPVSETSSFTSYAKDGFGPEEQEALAALFTRLAERGVKVVLSNSMTQWVRDRYSAFEIREVQATRSVNSKATKRGKIAEALVVAVD